MTILNELLEAICGKNHSTHEVDIEKIMDAKAAKMKGNQHWRTSVVDLLKLVDVDSSFEHRLELARALGYQGDPEDSKTMNMWLHRNIMEKLANDGGKVPDELRV